jgi:hypothetical protein
MELLWIDFMLVVRQDFDIILVFATSDHVDPPSAADSGVVDVGASDSSFR